EFPDRFAVDKKGKPYATLRRASIRAPGSVGGLPAPLCSRRPVSQMGPPYAVSSRKRQTRAPRTKLVTQHIVGGRCAGTIFGGFARSCGGGRGVGGVRAGGGRSVGISISTAIRWAQRWRAEGHAQARAMGGDHRSRLVEHRAAVLELVAQHP